MTVVTSIAQLKSDKVDLKEGSVFYMPKPYEQDLYEARAYSVAETAKLMGVCRSYVYQLIKSGRLRHIKLGSIKIPHEFLVQFYRESEGLDVSDPFDVKKEVIA